MCGCSGGKNRPKHAMPSAPRRIQPRTLSEPLIRQMALRKQVNDAAIAQQQQKLKMTRQRIIKDKLSR